LGAVFAEVKAADPVQAVFDARVTADDSRELARVAVREVAGALARLRI
jgi:hypothetical protein